jgi:hypothetical protein
MRRVEWICCLFLITLLSFAIAIRADEPDEVDAVPWPEDFVNRHGEYLKHARQYLVDHSTASTSARVAHDMLMVAKLEQRPEDVVFAQHCLLFVYPDTVFGHDYIKNADGRELNNLFKDFFCSTKETLDRDALDRFIEASQACNVWNRGYTDEEVLAQIALASRTARVIEHCRKSIRDRDGNPAKLLAVALDDKLTAPERIRKLQSVRYSSARAWQRYLFDRVLQEDERSATDLQAIIVENLLRDYRFEEALPKLKTLAASTKDPQHLFWLGWAQAMTGDGEGAAAAFHQLTREHADAAWSKTAERLSPLAKARKENLEQQIEVAEQAYTRLLEQPLERMEATVTWKADRRSFVVYANADIEKDAIEVIGSCDGKPGFAYKAAGGECRMFIAGDTHIREFASRGPLPDLKIDPGAVKLDLRYGFGSAWQGSGSLRRSVATIFSLPFWKSKENRREFVAWMGEGAFFEPIQKKDGKVVLRISRPYVDEPILDELEFEFDAEHQLTALAVIYDGERSAVRNIAYGARDKVTFSVDRQAPWAVVPPKWPELPVQQAAEFSVKELTRVLGFISDLAEAAESPRNAAAEPKPTPR